MENIKTPKDKNERSYSGKSKNVEFENIKIHRLQVGQIKRNHINRGPNFRNHESKLTIGIRIRINQIHIRKNKILEILQLHSRTFISNFPTIRDDYWKRKEVQC